MLLRRQLLEHEGVVDFKIRKHRVIGGLSRRRLNARKPIKSENPTSRPKLIIQCTDRNRRAGVLRIGHLTRNKLAPYQFVKAHRIRFLATQLRRPYAHISWANGLMRLLRRLLTGIESRRVGKICISICLPNKISGHANCVLTQISRVGSHVSNQTCLVKPLR